MEITSAALWKLLRQHSSFILTTHVSPDGDAVGSMLAMYEMLCSMGKSVEMVIDDTVAKKYQFLRYFNDFKTTEDTFNRCPDLLISLDASDRARSGRVLDLVQAPILNIDHHISNTKFADYVYLRPSCAANGEILAALMLKEQINISADMANALYLAIATDCGFFKFANTKKHTLEMASKMIEFGAQPAIISNAIEARSLCYVHYLGKVLETLETYEEGKIAGIVITANIMTLLEGDTDSFVDYPRSINTAEIAFVLKCLSDKVTRVSLRSKNIDVNKIAACFGGGGHIRASGCTINENAETAKTLLLEAIRAGMA
jgi:phosphoesterase RecJ-like protein